MATRKEEKLLKWGKDKIGLPKSAQQLRLPYEFPFGAPRHLVQPPFSGLVSHKLKAPVSCSQETGRQALEWEVSGRNRFEPPQRGKK